MAEDKKPTKKVARPKLEHKTKFQIANETLLDLYNKTISLLEEGIKKGATNSPLGLISFMAYVDLLHGGAYTVPITQRPFFINDKSKSPYWTEDLINQDAPQGFMGFLVSIFGGLNAGPLVQEVFEDANCPHVFPKLLSDEMYAYLRAVFAWFTTTNVLKEAGTGVETFVEASTLPIKAVSEAIERVTPSGEQLKQLTPLLSLLGGA